MCFFLFLFFPPVVLPFGFPFGFASSSLGLPDKDTRLCLLVANDPKTHQLLESLYWGNGSLSERGNGVGYSVDLAENRLRVCQRVCQLAGLQE